MSKEKKLKFEEALKRLEEIVALMEEGKLPLGEALASYEEGVKLTRYCAQTLDAAEKKIEVLAKSGTGEIEAKPFSIDKAREKAPGAKAAESKKKIGMDRKGEKTEEQFLF